MDTKAVRLQYLGIDLNLANSFLLMNGEYEDKGNEKVISGEIEIPLLGCRAELDLIVTDKEAEFSSQVELFGGVLGSIEVTANWDWDLTRFEGSVQNFKMGPFQVDNVSFQAVIPEDIVNFSAQASIPMLGCSASTVIRSNDTLAEFDANLNLFRGLINVNAHSKWNWDGSYFLLSFANTRILFLYIREAKIEFTQTSAEITFDATIFGATLELKGRIDQNGIILSLSVGNGHFQLSGAILFGGPDLESYRFDSSKFIEPLKPLQKSDRFTLLVRKVKIQHDSTNTNVLNIGEVEVYDQSNTNQAKYKQASQSSNYHGYSYRASSAVDGNPRAWWMVDLGSDLRVSKLVIKNRQDCCKNRLSSTTVSLLDRYDNVVGTYRIGDASQLDKIEIDTSEFALPPKMPDGSVCQSDFQCSNNSLCYGSICQEKKNIQHHQLRSPLIDTTVQKMKIPHNSSSTDDLSTGEYELESSEEVAQNHNLVADFLITTRLEIKAGIFELTVNGTLGSAHKHTCESEDRTGDFVKAMLARGFNAKEISSDLGISCSAYFQLFAELDITVVLKLSKILSFLPDLSASIKQKALVDYEQNGSNKMIRFQWYLTVGGMKSVAQSCLRKIPIIGDWLADEFFKSLEMEQHASNKLPIISDSLAEEKVNSESSIAVLFQNDQHVTYALSLIHMGQPFKCSPDWVDQLADGALQDLLPQGFTTFINNLCDSDYFEFGLKLDKSSIDGEGTYLAVGSSKIKMKELELPKLENGYVCLGSALCKSNYCSNNWRCEQQECKVSRNRPNDCTCMKDSNCKSGYCPWGTPGKCAPKRPNGKMCGEDEDCESGRCKYAYCIEKGSPGENCANGGDCKSGKCTNLKCAFSNGKLPSGTRCFAGYQCNSGWCSYARCRDKLNSGSKSIAMCIGMDVHKNVPNY
eukprot:scaffold248448_cov55-Cyclotella_meneghiniana.AAC.2